jgi:hypothetical protein
LSRIKTEDRDQGPGLRFKEKGLSEKEKGKGARKKNIEVGG